MRVAFMLRAKSARYAMRHAARHVTQRNARAVEDVNDAKVRAMRAAHQCVECVVNVSEVEFQRRGCVMRVCRARGVRGGKSHETKEYGYS